MTTLVRNEPLPFTDAEPRRHILAVDPGPELSAWVWFEDGHPLQWAKEPNPAVLELCGSLQGAPLVIEQVRSYGMPVGAEVFETVQWSGRFEERAGSAHYLPRLRVKLHHCHSPKANDATIRQAIIDRYGGRDRAIGLKATPGPLYGIKADCWSALALGLAWLEGAV